MLAFVHTWFLLHDTRDANGTKRMVQSHVTFLHDLIGKYVNIQRLGSMSCAELMYRTGQLCYIFVDSSLTDNVDRHQSSEITQYHY